MDKLRISLIQADLFWEQKNANLQQLEAKIATLSPTDLIILPEMFSTGFSMQPQKWAETMQGATVNWMLAQARKTQAAVVGSLIIEENGQYFNRLIVALAEQKLLFYDKRHLFALADEHNHYQAGEKKLVFEYKGWKIAPFVCYDLRFPVWSRNVENYDLAIYVANWPDRRVQHWNALLLARAIENQCFVAAVNRIGNDGNSIYHSGHSQVIHPSGEILSQWADIEKSETLIISRAELLAFREKLPFLADRDHFEVEI